MRRFIGALAAAGILGSAPATAQVPTLEESLSLPDWARLELWQRTRFELRDDQPSSDDEGGPDATVHGLLFRTHLVAGLDFEVVGVDVELMDARVVETGGDPDLDTTFVNPLDVLQAAVELRAKTVFSEQDRLILRVGRQTMDLGSRRLVARNRFRNTINAFGGLRVDYRLPGLSVRLFGFAPTLRRPEPSPNDVDGGDFAFDEEDFQTVFAGAWTKLAPDAWDGGGFDAYLLGLYETPDDYDRRLLTAGARFLRRPGPGRVDWEMEGAVQYGRVRSAEGPVVDREAQMAHVELGYTLEVPWTPRLELAVDFASGDDPETEADEGLDRLFGARAFDFGPTSFLVQYVRRNLLLAVLAVQARPVEGLKVNLSARLIGRDHDEAGGQGNRGWTTDLRLRWRPWGPGLSLSAGGAIGELDLASPSDTAETLVSHGYLQLELKI